MDQVRTAHVITASTRAAAGEYEDRTSPLITAWLRERGFDVPPATVVPDGPEVERALRAALGVDLVITTGGTGLTPTDRTPEATRAVIDHEVPGLADAIRSAGLPAVPTAVLSRGLAGVAGRTLVVNLPGSTGGVRDGLAVLAPILDHALTQLAGGDHTAPPDRTAVDHAASPHRPSSDNAASPHRSSGAQVLRADISETPITAAEVATLVTSATAGALVTFEGVVRDHDKGRTVTSLDYEGHPSAAETIKEVAADIAGRSPDVHALAVTHRVGPLSIGDVALACAVSAAHRRAAFTACADLVDEVKRRLPIWKHQLFADGTDEWVNCP